MIAGHNAYIRYRGYAAIIEWSNDDNQYEGGIYLRHGREVVKSFTSENLEEASAEAFSIIDQWCLQQEQHEQKLGLIFEKIQADEKAQAAKEIQAK